MIPDPLHPAVVHFPIALVVLLPLAALWALWAIRSKTGPRMAWAVPVALSALLTVSAFTALKTGEEQEDRVEAVVSEAAIHEHEERAELFLVLSGVVLLVMAGGLLGGTAGRASRLVATVGSVGLIAAGVLVGSSGGELVYEHGAAAAYVDGGASSKVEGQASREREDEEDDREGRS